MPMFQSPTDIQRFIQESFQELTLEQRKALSPRSSEFFDSGFNKWRCYGKPHVFTRAPERVVVPAKHGMYTYNHFYEHEVMLVGSEVAASVIRNFAKRGYNQDAMVRLAIANAKSEWLKTKEEASKPVRVKVPNMLRGNVDA